MPTVKRLAVVALIRDIPEHGLVRGQIGMVGEVLHPGVVEVDFKDKSGRGGYSLVVHSDDLVPLHRERIRVASQT